MPSPSFFELQFPLDVGFGAMGGPERRTDIVSLVSGHEERNARWADSRRRYDAGLGVRSLADLEQVIAFFEQCRGRLYGFRFRDPVDHSSAPSGQEPRDQDQQIGIGDGTQTDFQLTKQYGQQENPYSRTISKPVAGSILVAIDGARVTDASTDTTTGKIHFATPPSHGSIISAGFLFDVPVRFDADQLDISLTAFQAGDLPSIPLVELRS